MSKAGFILLLGVVGSIAAFSISYRAGTASSRALMNQPQPELAWLKKEFQLSDADYERTAALHQQYLPRCAERCRAIEAQNEKLRELLAKSPDKTDEIQAVMIARARIRGECEAEMLQHFIQVSRTMPPEQGQRYLAWVEQQTILQGGAMERQHQNHTAHQH
jgi:hypothetical protein